MTVTYRDKYNKKYGFPKGTSHSISAIAKTTGYSKTGLDTIYSKGEGAFYSNPQSVRKSVNSSEQWAMARIYSAIMGGKAARVDAAHLT